MTNMEKFQMCAGNPGAMQFVVLADEYDREEGSDILNRLEAYGIRGTDLYVLWSDICDRDVAKVWHVLRKAPRASVVDAAGRQDYSGRDLLKEYL